MKFNVKKSLLPLIIILILMMTINSAFAIEDSDSLIDSNSETSNPLDCNTEIENNMDTNENSNTVIIDEDSSLLTSNDDELNTIQNIEDDNPLNNEDNAANENNLRTFGSNLSVEKTTLNETVNVGDQVTFTIHVINNGWEAISNSPITIDDWADDGLVFDHYTTTEQFNNLRFLGLQETPQGNFYRWEYPIAWWAPFYPGYEIIFNVTYNTTKAGEFYNHVNVWIPYCPIQVQANNSTFVKDPDFTVEKILENETVHVGDEITYNIIVNNTGNVALGDVTIHEDYPDNLLYVNHSSGWTYENGIFTYDSPLDVNSAAILSITFKVLSGGNITNVATVNTNETGNKTSENKTFAYTPDISIEKISNNSTVELGETVSFTLVVTNTGDCDLNGVYIMDNDYSDGLEYLSYIDENNDWEFDGNGKWTYKNTLAPGESKSLEVLFKTISEGVQSNTAIAGHGLNNETVNSTNITNVTFEAPSNETNNTNPNETDTQNNTNTTDDDEKINEETNKDVNKKEIEMEINSIKTANPLFVLVLSLIGLILVPLRRLK